MHENRQHVSQLYGRTPTITRCLGNWVGVYYFGVESGCMEQGWSHGRLLCGVCNLESDVTWRSLVFLELSRFSISETSLNKRNRNPHLLSHWLLRDRDSCFFFPLSTMDNRERVARLWTKSFASVALSWTYWTPSLRWSWVLMGVWFLDLWPCQPTDLWIKGNYSRK